MAELKCKYCGSPIGECEKPALIVCGGLKRHEMQAPAKGSCGNLGLYPGLTNQKFINLFNKAIYLRQHMRFEKAANTLDYMISCKVNDVAVYFERALCNYGVVYSLDESIDAEHIVCRRMNEAPIFSDPNYLLALHRAKGEIRKFIEAMAHTIDSHQKQMQTCAIITEPKEIAICYSTVESGDIKNYVTDARRKLAERKFSVMLPTEDNIETEIAHLFRAADTAKTMIIVSDSPNALATTENYDCIKRFMARAAKDKSLRMAIICNNYDSAHVPDEFFDFITVETHFSSSSELFAEIKNILYRIYYDEKFIPEERPTKFDEIFKYITEGKSKIARMYIKDFVKSHNGSYKYYLARLFLEYGARDIEGLAISDSMITAGKYYNLALEAAKKTNLNDDVARLEKCAKENLTHCKVLYAQLRAEYKNLSTYSELIDTAEKFKLLGDLGDSADLALECKLLALNYPNAYVRGEFFVKYEQNRSAADSFEIPEGITCIRHDAFNGATDLKRIVIPEGVTAIESNAFYSCTSLSEVTLPKSLIRIDSGAFAGCSSLASIAFPESLQKIGSGAFRGCSAISSIYLPKNLARVGQGAFEGCTSLSSISICFIGESRARNNYFGYIFGAERYVRNGSCVPASLTSVTLRGNYTEIPESAFYNCTNIKSVELPKTIARIGNNAFYDCVGLERLPLTPSLVEIGDFAFTNCKSVELATLPNGIKTIGEHALRGCDNLVELVVPDSIESFGRNCLTECRSLKSLTVPFIGKSGEESNFIGHLFGAEKPDGNKDSLPESLESVIITPHYTEIPERAFFGCRALKSVKIPDDVTKIGEHAFAGCSSLSEASLPEAIVTVEESAFSGCRSITNMNFPESLKTVKERAFAGCSSLASVTLPDGIERVGASAFADTSALAEMTLPFVGERRNERTFIGHIFGAPSASQNGFYIPSSLKKIVLTPACTELATEAFFGCSSLASVEIPRTVTKLENSTFSGCRSLATLPVNDVTTSIGNSCFEGCASLVSIFFPASLKKIGDSAFKNCTAIETVEIPDTIETVGKNAFGGCTSLRSMKLAFIGGARDENTHLGYLFGSSDASLSAQYPASLTELEITTSVKAIPALAFNGATTLKSIKLPSNLESIGDAAFKRCVAIRELQLNESIKSIGEAAFEDCSSLESIVIPDSVESIGGGAFGGCISLVTITLPFIGGTRDESGTLRFIFDIPGAASNTVSAVPSSLTKVILSSECTDLPERAFENCSDIKAFELPDTVKAIGARAFAGCSALSEISLPESIASIGDEAFAACSALKALTIPNSAQKIGSNLLVGATAIKSVTIPTIVGFIGSLFGAASVAENKKLTPASLEAVKLTGDQDAVSERAFEGCQKIVSVSLPESISAISARAFNGCRSLSSVTAPGLKTIGEEAFKACTSLRMLDLPEVFEKIEEHAFAGCKNLTINFAANIETAKAVLDASAELPKKVKTIATKS